MLWHQQVSTKVKEMTYQVEVVHFSRPKVGYEGGGELVLAIVHQVESI